MKTLNELGASIVEQVNLNLRARSHEHSPENSLNFLVWQLTYSDKVHNNQCCPRKGILNFERNPKLPLHYPGWEGRLWLGLYNMTNSGMLHYFNNTVGHGGLGGASNLLSVKRHNPEMYKYSGNDRNILCWNFKMFEEDIPEIAAYELKDHKCNEVDRLLLKQPVVTTHHKPHKFIYIKQ